MSFISELRAAHAVFTAHSQGAETVGQITSRTGLPAHEVSTWVRLLRLKVVTPQNNLRLPFPALKFDI